MLTRTIISRASMLSLARSLPPSLDRRRETHDAELLEVVRLRLRGFFQLQLFAVNIKKTNLYIGWLEEALHRKTLLLPKENHKIESTKQVSPWAFSFESPSLSRR